MELELPPGRDDEQKRKWPTSGVGLGKQGVRVVDRPLKGLGNEWRVALKGTFTERKVRGKEGSGKGRFKERKVHGKEGSRK